MSEDKNKRNAYINFQKIYLNKEPQKVQYELRIQISPKNFEDFKQNEENARLYISSYIDDAEKIITHKVTQTKAGKAFIVSQILSDDNIMYKYGSTRKAKFIIEKTCQI